MSQSRKDPRKAKQRRDRIRQAKAASLAESYPPPGPAHPFASERAFSEIHALLDGENFESEEQLNARLQELMAGGQLSQRAQAWKQDDPKWQAQQLAYDALETDDLETALHLIDQALKLDPDCTDAQRLMVSLLPASPENKLHLMREVVATAERNFGEKFFAENKGHFWGITSTRPYMRAIQHLGELLMESGLAAEAMGVYARMLELNPRDNQGMRYRLVGLHLAAGDGAAADQLMAAYPEEEQHVPTFAWARVIERWLSGKQEEALAARARARKVNRFVEPYLSGTAPIPEQPPEYYAPGSSEEAIAAAIDLAPALSAELREWLRQKR